MTNAQMIRLHGTTKRERLHIAFELSNTKWKLAFGDGIKKRLKTIEARDLGGLEKEITRAKTRFGMAQDAQVFSCYEAGRDGFWIHRYLEKLGVHNDVVDSSSIEVNRRYRRAKTDRMDAGKLLSMLIRYVNGEQKLWSVLHVPDAKQEDDRRVNREIGRMKKERSAHTNRIGSLLILLGIKMRVGPKFLQCLDQATQWNGEKIPPRMKNEILREYERYELIQSQLKQLEAERQEILKSNSAQARQAQELRKFVGIGPVSSEVLTYEYFGWRRFKNVKQVGAAAGLAPTPYDSGGSSREQGINKAGNRRVRAVMIELSWYWLRYQPHSQLSRWYMQRFASGGKRMRRIGIVALARKLLIAFWKYLEKSIVPEGAVFKKAA